eukprot:m.72550 g.72550  ORF g.72550 m.72550 type:complete len:610 (+) comp8387_c0_seq1:86-1915(+)
MKWGLFGLLLVWVVVANVGTVYLRKVLMLQSTTTMVAKINPSQSYKEHESMVGVQVQERRKENKGWRRAQDRFVEKVGRNQCVPEARMIIQKYFYVRQQCLPRGWKQFVEKKWNQKRNEKSDKRNVQTTMTVNKNGSAREGETSFERDDRMIASGITYEWRNSWLYHSCEKPVVAWDTPLEGGLVTGLSSEAVSFLLPLTKNVTLYLPNVFREESSFVAGLSPSEQRSLRKLKALTNANLARNPKLYVSQWPPGGLFVEKKNKYGTKEDTYVISRAMYEATRLPQDWPPNFDSIDEFWVPSEWNKRVFVEEYGIPEEDVYVVEEGLNTDTPFNPALYNTIESRQTVYPADVQNSFIFLSVFKWEDRKNPLQLLKAFMEEFPVDENGEYLDDVHLFLRSTPNVDIKYYVQAVGGRMDARIHVLDKQLDYHYQQMFVGADAFVFPTHGEGWGRPTFEAMAMGLPVITTYWSGQTEYLNEDVAYLLHPSGLIQAQIPGGPPDGKWAGISTEDLRKKMRHVVMNREEAKEKGNRAREHIHHSFNEEIIASHAHAQLISACEKQKRGQFPRKNRKARQLLAKELEVEFQRIPRSSDDWVYTWAHQPCFCNVLKP